MEKTEWEAYRFGRDVSAYHLMVCRLPGAEEGGPPRWSAYLHLEDEPYRACKAVGDIWQTRAKAQAALDKRVAELGDPRPVLALLGFFVRFRGHVHSARRAA